MVQCGVLHKPDSSRRRGETPGHRPPRAVRATPRLRASGRGSRGREALTQLGRVLLFKATHDCPTSWRTALRRVLGATSCNRVQHFPPAGSADSRRSAGAMQQMLLSPSHPLAAPRGTARHGMETTVPGVLAYRRRCASDGSRDGLRGGSRAEQSGTFCL